MSRLRSLYIPVSRVGIVAAAMTGAVLSTVSCGGDPSGTGGETGSTGSTTGKGGSGGNGTGGNGTGGTTPIGNPTTTKAVPLDAAHATVFDATLSNDGSIVYFSGVGSTGPGVFSVPVAGGAVASILEGSPFAAPYSLALATDGKRLYIADPGAEGTALDHGRILSVDPELKNISPIMTADDTSPRGIDVVAEGGADQIYYTGTTTAGVPGIFKVAASGGAVKTVASGPPLVDPQGIAVTKSGTIYVLDALGAKTGRASVLVYDGTALTELTGDIAVGYPCGLALGLDEKSLLISSLDPAKGGSSLLIIDIFSKEPTRFPTDGSLDKKLEPGGIHRARNAQSFAWVSYDPTGPSILIAK